jgi:hypothetical protein
MGSYAAFSRDMAIDPYQHDSPTFLDGGNVRRRGI